MLLKIGSHGSGVDRRVPVTILIAEFKATSMLLARDECFQQGAQYSATE